MFWDKDRKRKFFTLTALTIFVSFNVFVFTIFPSSVVHAAAAAPVAEVESAPQKEKAIEDKIIEGVLSALMGSLVNFTSHFMRTLAYDTAVYIASGGKGEGSLIFEKPFDEYLLGVTGDSAGAAIDALGEEWGLDLCAPPSLDLQAGLKVGLSEIYDATDLEIGNYTDQAQSYAEGVSFGDGPTGRPQSSCTFNELKGNWFDEDGNLKAPEVNIDMAADFAADVDVTETDFGYMLGAIEKVDRLEAHQEESASLERLAGEGFKAVTDLISGEIKTPPTIVEEEATALTGKHQGEQNAEQIAGMYASELWQIIPMSASVFLNTLTSELLNRVFTKGLVPAGPPPGSFDFYGVSALLGKRKAAERAFSFLTVNNPTKSLENYDITAFYASCPNPDNPGINECVINSDFKTIIDIASNGRPLTIYQAIFEEELIDENTQLISPRRTSDNESPDCRNKGFCHSNVQKLRKARVLPLGFEIATLRSDPDNPWTIGEVVKGFEDCTVENGEVILDSNKPFCHLIDPNWVIRAPEARCEAFVDNPILQVENSPKRKNECADISTCITEDPNGSCSNDDYFAYCTKESNVWHLPGDSCPAEYVTCQNFFNETTKENVSYLSRTLDYGSCDVDSVGCSAYSVEKINGEWVGTASDDYQIGYKSIGRNQVINFNEKITAGGTKQNSSCSPENDGCTLFYSAERIVNTLSFAKDVDGNYIKDQNDQLYLKKAPYYLGCYDTDLDTPEIEWPTTLQQVTNNIDGDSECSNFAQVCVEEEIGCDLYTPINGGAGVPGVVGNNICHENCVGYETFQQEATNFESSDYPLYFIPKNGDQCNLAYEGCDEFTNIDAVSAGGEGLEYYTYIKRCEKPEGENSNVYYSWEGSGTEGYVLKVHNLARVGTEDASYISSLGIDLEIKNTFTADSPAYIDDTVEILEENYAKCNEDLYNNLVNNIPGVDHADEDCRALYGTDGSIYYRILADTVTVSEACHPLRKSESRLEVDLDIDQSQCLKKKGIWGSVEVDGDSITACQRCYAGGEWNEDSESCIYHAIDAVGESTSCPAEFNGCRAYSGNAANNVESVFGGTETFEVFDAGDADALNNAKEGWSPQSLKVSPESLQVGGYSLEIDVDLANKIILSDNVKTNTSYELSFWARGVTQNVDIYLQQGNNTWSLTLDPLLDIEQGVSIGSTWKKYQVGPVQFNGSEDEDMFLVFDRSDSLNKGIYYIDNIELFRVDEKEYLIKNSWKTPEGYDAPEICFDPGQNPAGPFPGADLGCQEYSSILSPELVYTTGFESLCREEAVGCQPVYDTYNTLEGDDAEYTQVFHAKCVNGTYQSAIGQDVFAQTVIGEKIVGQPVTCSQEVAGQTYECVIGSGQDHCYIDEPVVIPSPGWIFGGTKTTGELLIKETPDESGNPDAGDEGLFLVIDNSSILIPADTPDDSPLFLTNSPESRCLEDNPELGCQKVALEDQILPDDDNPGSYNFHENFVINNPDNYLGTDGTICLEEQLACGRFSFEGQTAYFKDPLLNGHKFCQYLPETTINGSELSGWFLQDGIGRCSVNDGSGAEGELCLEDSECGAGNICLTEERIPCYPDYLDDFASYGLWSNGAPEYDGFVGLCEPQYHTCTEFLDPMDVNDNHPDGKPYYILDNDNLDLNNECGGQVSLREGCVLFDQTDNPSKIYNTALTYAESEEKAKGGFGTVFESLVPPLSDTDNPANNNANRILKVDRDRQCSEWLECKSFVPFELENGRDAKLCYELRSCDETDGNNCTNWVTRDVNDISDDFLDYDKYINRDTSWYGDGDYSGYSLFESYQIGDFAGVDIPEDIFFGDDDEQVYNDEGVDVKNYYLVYRIPNSYFEFPLYSDQACPGDATDWITTCGPDDKARCVQGKCVLPISGDDFPGSINQADYIQKLAEKVGSSECKAPSSDQSPLPTTVAILNDNAKNGALFGDNEEALVRYDFNEWKSGYKNTNVCQDGECACEYVELTYGDLANTSDFWSLSAFYDGDTELSSSGICSGGLYSDEGDDVDRNGWFCQSDGDCDNPGFEGQSNAECEPIAQKDIQIGITGHCLEYDLSRPIYGKGSDEYACLTWYPVDTSASNIDTYNVYKEAGFDPELDAAEEFKGLYCTNSTDPHNVVDESEHKIIQNPNTGIEGLPEDDDCYLQSMLYDSDEEDYGCHRGNFYTYMTAWTAGTNENGEKNIDYPGTSFRKPLIVLRSEYSASRKTKWGGYHCGKDDSTEGDQNSCDQTREEHSYLYEEKTPPTSYGTQENGIVPYSLLPRPMHYKFDGIKQGDEKFAGSTLYPQPLDKPLHVASLGTIYHPERTEWDIDDLDTPIQLASNHAITDNPVSYVGYPASLENENYYVENQTYKNTDLTNSIGEKIIYNAVAAPGPKYYPLGGANIDKALYRSPFEFVVNEYDLNRIYFVPTAFPGGMQRFNPLLLDNNIYIDFNKVRFSPNKMDDDRLEIQTYESLFSDNDNNIGCRSYLNGKKRGFVDGCDESDQSANLGVVRTYMIERGVNDEIKEDQSSLDRKYENISDERSKVHRRYVLLFYEGISSKVPWVENATQIGNLLASGEPYTPTIDHFFDNVFIETVGEEDVERPVCYAYRNTNWFAIGMDFNEDGEFLGYLSRWCNDYMQTLGNNIKDALEWSDIWENGINLTVVAELNNMCTEFVQTYDIDADNIKDFVNKPWTNRLWDGALDDSYTEHVLKNKDQAYKPFGSIDMEGSDLEYEGAEEFVKSLRTYAFVRDGSNDQLVPYNGIPYSCLSPFIMGFTKISSLLSNTLSPAEHNFCLYHDDEMVVNSEYVPEESIEPVRNMLKNLFANFIRVVNRHDEWSGSATYEGWVNEDFEIDHAGDIALNGDTSPPKIYSLNPATCFPKNSNEGCTPGEVDNITVDTKNGTLFDYDGEDGPDEDPFGESPHIIVAAGSHLAHVRFFALADDNRMPIRRVQVDWGDGTISNEGREGMYKNHKPYCEQFDGGESNLGFCRPEGETGAPTLITCQDFDESSDCPFVEENQTPYECVPAIEFADQDFGDLDRFDVVRFGNAPRACEPTYFEFSNNYSCNKAYQETVEQAFGAGKISKEQKDRLVFESGLSNDSKICVFIPRVQVLDNWGWCNGECVDGYEWGPGFAPVGGVTEGCYNGADVLDWSGDLYQCDASYNVDYSIDAWTYYRGAVVIIPD